MIALLESDFQEAFVCHRCQLVDHLQSKILDLEGQLAERLHSSQLSEFQELDSTSFKDIVCTPQPGGGQTSDQAGRESWVTVGRKRRKGACTLHRGGISRGGGVQPIPALAGIGPGPCP